ncbi:ribonuclease H-like domain-containing protein [Tanacetum coccineum]
MDGQDEDLTSPHTKSTPQFSLTKALQVQDPSFEDVSINSLLDKLFSDSGLAVPVFKQGDDPIDAINKMMSFLSTVVTSYFPSTNNQLRNSSNPRKQTTIHDGRVTVQALQGRPNSYVAGTSRTRAYLLGNRKEIMQVQPIRNGKVLNEEELEFLANPDVAEGPVTQSVLDVLSEVPHSDNTNNDMLNQSVQEMPYSEPSQFVDHPENEIHNDSNIIPYSQYLVETQNAVVQDTNSSAQQDAMILSVFEQLLQQVTNCNKVNKDNLIANESLSVELERYKERVKLLEERQNVDLDFVKRFVPQQELSVEQAFWFQMSNPSIESSDASLVKVDVPSELPKINDSVNVNVKFMEMCNKCLELEAELIKQDNMVEKDEYNKLSKSYSKLEQHCISLELAMQLNKEIFQTNNTFVNQNEPTFDQLETHIYYLKHTMEQAAILREIVEQAKLLNPLDSASYTAFAVMPINKKKIVRFTKLVASSRNIPNVTNRLLLSSTGVKPSTSASRSKPSGNTKNDRIRDHPSSTWRISRRSNLESTEALCSICNECLFDANHVICLLDYVNSMNVVLKSAYRNIKREKNGNLLEKCLTLLDINRNPQEGLSPNIRTDNGTEFVNQTLRDYYEQVGISHETSVARTPQQNGVVEKQNHTLVEAAQTISRLIPNPPPSASFVPPLNYECDLVFQPVIDEFFSPPASVASLVPTVEALALVESTGTPSSTSVEQDAPSLSTSQSTQQSQSHEIPFSAEEESHDLDVAYMSNDPYFGILIPETTSEESSSTDVIHTNVHSDAPISEHLRKWTKDHSLQNIIGELSRPVSTRLQLHEQALFCYYDAFQTYPDKVMVVTLKWIYKVKLDELGGNLKNKARLVARGYVRKRIDFKESFRSRG